MPMKSMSSFNIGDKAVINHAVTQTDIERFVQLTGDDNPLHIDPLVAERTEFKGTVAHGMLSASFISTLVGKYLPGQGALLLSQNLDYLLPVRIGDELAIQAVVVEKHPSMSVLVLDTTVCNQFGQICVRGKARVKLIELTQGNKESDGKSGNKERPKVVLITGAGRGIGAATARRLASDGYSVAINYRQDETSASQVVSEIMNAGGIAKKYRADITDRRLTDQMIRSVIDRFGNITAVVLNATDRIIGRPFTSLSAENIESQFNLHVLANFHLLQSLLPIFIENGGASVVALSSIYATDNPSAQLTDYIIAKAGLVGMIRSLAAELGPKGIRLNVVSPGITDTRLMADIPQKTRLLATAQTPLRHLASPDDIANGIAFLLSDRAAHITGQVLRISGGL